MNISQNRIYLKTLVFLLSCCLFAGCAIPISTSTKYPIDIFMEKEMPSRPYTELREVEITSEDSLSQQQIKGGTATRYKGKSFQDKEVLKAQLVLKAQKLGADAIINVRYQFFASATAEGYSIKGTAVRYRGE